MPDAPPDSDEEEPQTITTWITLHTPVLSRDARAWRFTHNGVVIWIDISETTILADTLQRGVNYGDSYLVRLESTQVEKDDGTFTAKYKIKEILNFKQGHGGEQGILEGM